MPSRQMVQRSLSDLLKKNVAEAVMTRSQAQDVQKQFRLFQSRFPRLQKNFRGQVVAFAGGKQFAGLTLGEVVSQVDAALPNALFYAEEIPAKLK